LSAKRKSNAGSFTIRGFKDVDRQKKKECWFGYDPGFPPPAPKRISARTKAALAAAKERGRKLGGIRCRVIRVDESGKKTYGEQVLNVSSKTRAMYAALAYLKLMGGRTQGRTILPPANAARLKQCPLTRVGSGRQCFISADSSVTLITLDDFGFGATT